MTITHALDTALFDAAYSKAMAATGDTKAAMAAGLGPFRRAFEDKVAEWGAPKMEKSDGT